MGGGRVLGVSYVQVRRKSHARDIRSCVQLHALPTASGPRPPAPVQEGLAL
jgi:hypothetical protein